MIIQIIIFWVSRYYSPLTRGSHKTIIAGVNAQADLDVPVRIKFVMMLGSPYQHCGPQRLPEDMMWHDGLWPGDSEPTKRVKTVLQFPTTSTNAYNSGTHYYIASNKQMQQSSTTKQPALQHDYLGTMLQQQRHTTSHSASINNETNVHLSYTVESNG